MACRLVKEHIRPLRWVGQGSAQTAVEGAVMLGESSVQLVTSRAKSFVQSAEVRAEGIAVQGTVEFAVLYLDAQGMLGCETAQSGFSAVISVEGAAAGQQAQVMVSVTGVTAMQQGSRLEMTAQLMLCGMVMEEKQVSAAVDAVAEDEMAKRFVQMQTLSTAWTRPVSERLAQTIPLAQEGMERVLWSKPHCEITYRQAMDGAVEVTGLLGMDCLLMGETAGDVLWQRAELPFVTELVGDGIRSDMQLSVEAQVQDVNVHLLKSEEGNPAALYAECTLMLRAQGWREQPVTVLQDAYPLTEAPFEAQPTLLEAVEAQEESEQTQRVETLLDLPPDAPPIRHIVGTFAVPVMLETIAAEDMRAEGLLRVTLLYRTDGQEALERYEQEVPFGVTFEEIAGLSQVWRIEVGDAEAQRLGPMQAQVRVEVEMEAMQSTQARTQVVEAVTAEGESAVLPAGITLYYPEEHEGAWEVAKRYRVREESLKMPEEGRKAPVLGYRRLTAF